MRRASHLFDSIACVENIKLAFYKAARGKRHKTVVQRFASRLDQNATSLVRDILNHRLTLGSYHQFVIRDPKERIITAPCFRERVLHHAIMNVCEPVFDSWQIFDSYACRRGKGREAAIRRAQRFSKRFEYCLKLDVRKYFDSIDHGVLICLLSERIKDQKLMRLLASLIQSFRVEIGCGLPIGSLTSQHFANFYLGCLDRFIKERLGVRGYVRYMDDMIVWTDCPGSLRGTHQASSTFVENELHLKFKPSQIRPTTLGVSFLGCRVWPTHVSLNRHSKRRWSRQIRLLARCDRLGLMTEQELQNRLTSLTSFSRSAGAKSWQFRRSVLNSVSVDDQ